jgi:D-alanyl-D-alanine carboxypeptidase
MNRTVLLGLLAVGVVSGAYARERLIDSEADQPRGAELAIHRGASCGLSAGVHSKEIDEILSRIKEKYGLQAVIVGIASGNGEIVTQAVGNSMTGVKAAPNMHWRIGAVTHTMYTTLLLRYVDQHIVSLEDKLSKWFPELPGSDRVTLRMLSNNTSSYDDYVYLPQFLDVYLDDPFREWTDDELVAIGAAGPKTLAYPPGKGFNYSHTNFVLLKQVLEKIGGEPIEQLLRKHILQPLRLRDTEYPLDSDIASPALHAFVIGQHDVYQESTYWSPSWTSGPMSSNVCDLIRWSRALGRGTLLSPASRKEMFAPVTVGLDLNEPSFYYAMGVIVANTWVVQTPSYSGFYGLMAYLPSKDISINVVSTLSREGAAKPFNYSMLIFVEIAKLLAPDVPVPERILEGLVK